MRIEGKIAIVTGAAQGIGRGIAARLDIRDASLAGSVVKAALARFGRIDVLVNNAGCGQFGPFWEVEPEAIEREFATNVFGASTSRARCFRSCGANGRVT